MNLTIDQQQIFVSLETINRISAQAQHSLPFIEVIKQDEAGNIMAWHLHRESAYIDTDNRGNILMGYKFVDTSMIQYVHTRLQEKYYRGLFHDRVLEAINREAINCFMELTRSPESFWDYGLNCFIRQDITQFALDYLAQ